MSSEEKKETKKKTSIMKGLIEYAGMIVAVGTLAIGLLQYKKAQDWQRSEFASQQLEKLSHDPMLSLATKTLEWKNRVFLMPDQYKLVYNSNTFSHKSSNLAKALIPGTEDRKLENESDAIYPDIFDNFFDYLERIDHYLNIGLFTMDDIKSICYWVDLVEHPKHFKSSVFKKYLTAYGYTGVFNFMKRCHS